MREVIHGLIHSSSTQNDEPQIIVGCIGVWPDLKSLLIVLDRLLQSALPRESQTEIIVGVGTVPIHGQCLSQMLDSFSELFLFHQLDCQGIVSDRIIGGHRQGMLKKLTGRLPVAQLHSSEKGQCHQQAQTRRQQPFFGEAQSLGQLGCPPDQNDEQNPSKGHRHIDRP